jgi:UDP:flavonoid glycosyltransferase YjiC (YdhE family)
VKIVICPFGVGLAHVGRTMMIARELKKRQIEVVFAAGPEAIPILRKEDWPVRVLPELTREDYNRKLKRNNPFVYTRRLITQFIGAETAILRWEKPDAVVFDNRLTAKISARVLGIPTIAVTNADLTPYYDFSRTRFPIRTVLARYLPGRFVSAANSERTQRLLRRVGPKLFPTILASETLRLAPALLRLGYIPTKNPFQFFLGDLTLLVDIPEFRTVKELPPSVKMVGPIFMENIFSLPSWHKSLEPRRRVIYVTAAGTGDKETFLSTLKFLKNSDYTVVATTGNTLSPKEVKSSDNLYVTDFLPGKWIFPKALLAISPGGNSTVYQAMHFGVPQICTPFHIDQEDNANQLERLGVGISILPYKGFSEAALVKAMSEITTNPLYARNARMMMGVMKKYRGAEQSAVEILRYCQTLGKRTGRSLTYFT